MQSLRLLARQIQQACLESGKSLRQKALPVKLHQFLPAANSITRVNTLRKRLKHRESVRQAVILVFATLALTSAFGHRFYNQPQLSVGKIAPQTIEAPANAAVEDKQATEEKRKMARKVAVTVFMNDAAMTDQIRQNLQTALTRGTTLRQQVGAFPFVNTQSLAEPVQRYLRNAEEWEWRLVMNAALEESSSDQNSAANGFANPDRLGVQLNDPLQRRAAEALQRYRTNVTAGEFSKLRDQIAAARRRYAAAIAAMQDSTAPLKNVYDPSLFDVPNAVWQKTQTEIKQTSERILAQGIPPGLPQNQLENAINLHLQIATPQETRAIALKVLLSSLKSNLVKDNEQSRMQAEKAAQEVQPEIITVRRGKIIAQAGQPITRQDFVLLDHFRLSRRETNWLGLIAFGILVGGSVVLFWQVEQHFHPKGLRNRDYWLVSVMAVSTPLLVILGLPATNLPAIGFLMSTFYGSLLSVTLVGTLSGLLPMGMAIGVTQWFPSAAGALLAAVLAGRLRSREELALLGVGVGSVQGALYLLLGALSGVVWYGLIGKAALHALIGLAWTIVAIGISPYLEHVFDLVTTIRLVELANPNRPLLKKLAAETPGTFQHTLFVATLAEAAARELGCNVELVRTGTLYHDIGKMHDPLSFIENQMGGDNKHDLIDDPWMSADIIKRHVTEGLVMARKARLPKIVQAFIPEHQGTMVIAYFYHHAQQLAKEDPTIVVNEADFRYDGPIPQSRETGIVMLADSCEAALRSLRDATPDEALNMINKILAARWKDGQLDESELTREEMSTIAQVFVRVWKQSNHQRIVYPKVGK